MYDRYLDPKGKVSPLSFPQERSLRRFCKKQGFKITEACSSGVGVGLWLFRLSTCLGLVPDAAFPKVERVKAAFDKADRDGSLGWPEVNRGFRGLDAKIYTRQFCASRTARSGGSGSSPRGDKRRTRRCPEHTSPKVATCHNCGERKTCECNDPLACRCGRRQRK